MDTEKKLESEREKHFKEEKEIFKHKMPEPHLIPDHYDKEPEENTDKNQKPDLERH